MCGAAGGRDRAIILAAVAGIAEAVAVVFVGDSAAGGSKLEPRLELVLALVVVSLCFEGVPEDGSVRSRSTRFCCCC